MTGDISRMANAWRIAAVLVLSSGILAALCGSTAAQEEEPVRYDGYQLWRVIPQSALELEVLESIVNTHNLSYWLYPSKPGRPVDVMVHPGSQVQLTPFFKRSFSSFEVRIADIQDVISEQYRDRARPGQGQNAEFTYDQYHDLDQINAWIDQIVARHHVIATKHQIGVSYEARPIHMIKISVPASKTSRNSTASGKPALFIEGGIHAREWISPATVIYMTNQLLKGYESNPEVTAIVTAFDWYILPVFNVDGYSYTWSKNRLWRKTRSPTTNPLCTGTDPNRNWDDHWCENGASRNPCSETYCGSSAFSEIEVKSVADFLASPNINFVGFIDFHSYSQLWMTPYGWTEQHPRNKDYYKQNAQSEACVQALEAVHGARYESGTIAETIYIASGNSVDWVYSTVGVLYSVTVELRDMGQYGFLLPANQIVPTGEETFAGLKAYANYILKNSL